MNSINILKKYFPEINEEQEEKFQLLAPLYTEWNQKINVISRKDIDELYERHILHSLGIAKVLQFTEGTKILDVGTGGGFPGIPLAILFPEAKFHLVDSIGKKITVVEQVSKALGLKNIQASHQRAEDVNDKFDFVVSRAVTRIAPFYQWIKNKIIANSNNTLTNGILYLKGGDLQEEFAELNKPYQSFDLTDYFEEPFFETKKVMYVPIAKI
ncbi:MAG: 16S rRNA (guanine(527)-N(7))-methyltransferase RsmG [Cytophagales bacterium]|nr:MAG: 16S rRNA (guanine(527)-N(7))-methyltransferase RsmG [Cytophagales bacterium]